MNALVLGAGNIGRGFIGSLLTKSGFSVVFADVNAQVVEQLNARGSYPIMLVDDAAEDTEWVRGVRAIDARDVDAVAREVAKASILATAVGAANLSRVAKAIALGIAMRIKQNAEPANILVCENMIGANRLLREQVAAHLGDDAASLDAAMGFVEVSIGRMVPASDGTGDPLLLRLEPYAKLPYDESCWRGKPLALVGAVPCKSFGYQIARKLFVHNMGHAIVGYMGYQKRMRYIHEAMADAGIKAAASDAMQESAKAIARRFPDESHDIADYTADLLRRFGNQKLCDPIARVCADPLRKLSKEDRLIGAYINCRDQGIDCKAIIQGILAALSYDNPDDPGAQEMQKRIAENGLPAFILEHCGVEPESLGIE